MIYVVQIFFCRSLFYVQYFYGCLTYYQNKNIFEKLGHGAIQKKFAQFSINTFRQFKTAVNKSHFFPLQALCFYFYFFKCRHLHELEELTPKFHRKTFANQIKNDYMNINKKKMITWKFSQQNYIISKAQIFLNFKNSPFHREKSFFVA